MSERSTNRVGGTPLLPHVGTFSAVFTTPARTYRWWFDEALRHSWQNARAMRRDPYLMSLLRVRQMGIVGLPYTVIAVDSNDPIAKVLADEVKMLIDSIPRFRRILFWLTEALWYGKYGVQLVYGDKQIDGHNFWIPVNSFPVNGDKIIFKWSGIPGILVNPNVTNTELFGYYRGLSLEAVDRGLAVFLYDRDWRDQFIIHSHEPDDMDYIDGEMAGGVFGVGLRSRVYWLWWLRQEVLSWMMSYMERVGAGGIIEIPYEYGNDESRQRAEELAAKLQESNVALVPQMFSKSPDYFALRIHSPSHAGSNILFEIIRDYEKKIAHMMLGYSDLVDSYAYMAYEHVVEQVRTTLEYDAKMLAETITTDLVEPLIRRNYPSVSSKYRVRLEFDIAALHVDRVMKAYKFAYDMGVRIREADVRRVVGCSEPAEGDTVVQNPAYVQMSSMAGGHQNGVETNQWKGAANIESRIDGREPYEFTRSEYIARQLRRFVQSTGMPPDSGLAKHLLHLAARMHKASVLKALESGMEVPYDVMRDYPDLHNRSHVNLGDQVVVKSNGERHADAKA